MSKATPDCDGSYLLDKKSLTWDKYACEMCVVFRNVFLGVRARLFDTQNLKNKHI